MKKLLLIAIAGLFTQSAFTQNMSPDNWNDYTGSHYRTQPWGGWIREPFQANTGNYILDSGIVYNQIDTTLINNIYNTLLTVPLKDDFTLQTKGLGSGRDSVMVKKYMNRIVADNGLNWRNLCKAEAKKFAGIPNGNNRIYWQIGNEVTSQKFSQNLHLWEGSAVPCNGQGCAFDTSVMPLYVEYYLAPSVQGINEASMELFGSPDSIFTMLGSVTSAGSNNAAIWLNAVLNYTVQGTYAPALAGKKVYELIDIVSLHYIMGNLSSSQWKLKMDAYKTQWMGVGKIKGIWSTEEVGINAATAGRGAIIASVATSRYLEWAIENNFSKQQCRTNYYANSNGPVNTKVNDVQQEIFNFLGATKLSLVASNLIQINNSNTEHHAFLNNDSTKALIYTFMDKNSRGSISQIDILNSAMGNITGATCHYFTSTGHQIFTPTITTSLDTFLINLGTPVVLDSTKRILITLIQTLPLITSVSETSLPDENDFMIYPNPSTNILHIQLSNSQTAQIKIINVLGEELLSKQIYNGKNTIDVSELSNGIYVVNIISSRSASSKKLVIQK